MVSFQTLTKKVSILCCVLRATVAKYHKIHRWFSGISDSMVQKHMFWASPRRGTDGRTDARTHGGIISFELSPLKRCMRINSNKGGPRVTESDWEWNQSQEKRGERMWDREDRVRWESEKCMVLAGRYWYLPILPMVLAGRYWNSRFQPLILWCVLSIWQKSINFMPCFEGDGS